MDEKHEQQEGKGTRDNRNDNSFVGKSVKQTKGNKFNVIQ